MNTTTRDPGEQLEGTCRRFGDFGPRYEILAVHEEGGAKFVDVEVPETGEKVTLPLAEVLADPKAD